MNHWFENIISDKHFFSPSNLSLLTELILSFSPSKWNGITRYRYKILFLSEKSHEYENLQQFNNFSVTRLHFHFTSDFKDRMGRRRDIRAPFIFIIKPAQVDWNPHSNSHKRQKTKTFIRLIHNASFEKLFGSRKT